MNTDDSLISRTAPRQCLRVLATLVLLIALAGCGRDNPKPTIIGQALAPEPTLPAPSTTTTLPPEPSTSTTAAPRRAVTRLADPTPPPTAKPRTPPTTAAEPTTTTIAAPAAGTLSSHGGPVRDHVSLVDNLRGRGLTVTPVEQVRQPFLRADGTVLAVSGAGIGGGARLQSFDYATAEAAAADAATFGSDGNPRGFMVNWVAPPHLYLRGSVLVIYVGSDAAVTGVLTDLVGPQFAGR